MWLVVLPAMSKATSNLYERCALPSTGYEKSEPLEANRRQIVFTLNATFGRKNRRQIV